MRAKLLLSTVAACALFAQKPAPEQPVNRSKSRLVEVNVIVRDKNGPVPNLTQKDFTLFDKGKEQKIASFVASSRTANPRPLPPNVYANRASLGAPPAGITVILLDSLNTQLQVQTYARAQVLKVLEELKPSQRVVLAVLGDRLHLLTDLLGSYAQPGALEKWIKDNSITGGMDITNRLHGTTDALVTLSADLRHFVGRKSLVWVAGMYPVSVDHYGAEGPPGFEESANRISARDTSINGAPQDPTQIDRQIFQKTFSPAMEALNFAGLSVYAVDARGLVDMPTANTAAGITTGSANVRGSNTTLTPPGTDALRILVEDSGGRAAESTNDVQTALRQAIDDSAVTYTLGYYPDPKSLDTHFHSLKVQVARPDVELRYRQGYVALPDPLTVDKRRTESVKQALVNPLAVDGIGLLGTCQKTDQPKPGSLRTTVLISVPDLQLEQAGDQYTGELEITLTPRSADGKDRGTIRQGLALKLTQAQYDTVVSQGLPFNTTLDTSGDVAELRAVVCDHLSGRLGSLILPVK